jgi:hypothetical protein
LPVKITVWIKYNSWYWESTTVFDKKERVGAGVIIPHRIHNAARSICA